MGTRAAFLAARQQGVEAVRPPDNTPLQGSARFEAVEVAETEAARRLVTEERA
jgi:hypothetical protein